MSIRMWNNLARENTGSHLCDSGMVYGYNYNRKPNKKPVDMRARLDRNEVSATMSAQHYCDAFFKKDEKMHRKFHLWAKKQNACWLGCIETFIEEVLGVESDCDYTYNMDNDLDRDLQIVHCDYEGEDYYFVQMHNGCDARGGLSSPIVCTQKGHSDFRYNVTVGWAIWEGHVSGRELTLEECQALDEEWQTSYSAWPTGKMQDKIEKIVSVDEKQQTFVAILDSGETVKIGPRLPY